MTKNGYTKEDLTILKLAALDALKKRVGGDVDAAMDPVARARKMAVATLNRASKGVTYGGPLTATMALGMPIYYSSYKNTFLSMDGFLRPPAAKSCAAA